MFGMGMTEILVILVLALLVIGPKKLPELARTLGKGFREFQRASDDLRKSFTEEYSFDEERRKLRKEFENLSDSVTDIAEEPQRATTASGEWQPPGTETAGERPTPPAAQPETQPASPVAAEPAAAPEEGAAHTPATAEHHAQEDEKPAAEPEAGAAAAAPGTPTADHATDEPPKSES